jgi:hypothetical protein
MGDLIQKLPTDSVPLPPEEKQNFFMLFPPSVQEKPPSNEVPQQQQSPPSQGNKMTTQKLKKECCNVFLFVLVFFILNVPYVKQLLMEYIPLCSKSWMVTNLLQAIIFALVLWLILNSEYSRV